MTPKMLAEKLGQSSERVCRHLLPSGKRAGNEWRCGDTSGDQGQSLGVHLQGEKAGIWSDFSTGEAGDLLDLWVSCRHISLAAAMREAQAFLGVRDAEFIGARAKTYRMPLKPECTRPKDDTPVAAYLKGRGLTDATIRAYCIGEKLGEIVFPSLRNGELISAKYLALVRLAGKKKMRVEAGTEPCLFGWQAIPESARSITLCEGEIDAMSLHQSGYPALSVPFGGGGGAKQAWIENEYPRLERFDEIYLCFDNDSEGTEAQNTILTRLGRHRCRIVELPHKDANEALQAGCPPEDFQDWFSCAKTIDPKSLRSAVDYTDDVIAEFYPPPGMRQGMLLPWTKTGQTVMFRPSEVTVWTGISGHGKTQLLNHVMVSGMRWGERACIASMEMPPRRSLHRIIKQVSGAGEPSIPTIRRGMEWLSDKLWLFDVVGTTKTDELLEVFAYAARRYGVTQFVVDSLAKCGISEDDYNGQKAFVESLVDFSHEYDVHAHLVVHPRKGADESHAPGKLDVKGAGAITDMADNVLTIWRNKRKEKALAENDMSREDEPDVKIYCNKQRYSGWEGQIALWFDTESLQYLAASRDRPAHYSELDAVA